MAAISLEVLLNPAATMWLWMSAGSLLRKWVLKSIQSNQAPQVAVELA